MTMPPVTTSPTVATGNGRDVAALGTSLAAADPAIGDPAVQAMIAQVADFVREGECTLFLGAGAHSLPPAGSAFHYPASDAPPRGGELSELLAKGAGVDSAVLGDVRDLRRVSLYWENQPNGRWNLIQAVRQAVQVNRQPSPMLRALASLPFTHIITTNYDTLFERALAQAGKDFEVSVYTAARRHPKSPSKLVGPNRPFLLKIHGDFESESAPPDSSVVITEEDYITFVLRMRDADDLNPVPLAVRATLAQNPTLFVGYSLGDYNLRMLFRALRYSGDMGGVPSSFSVDPWPNPILQPLLMRDYQIVFLSEDLWTFVPALFEAVTGRRLEP